MPTLTRWFIKTSFIYLALALITGLLLAAQSLFSLAAFGGLFPVYIHLLVFGWLTQLVFGVVFWMFPKYSTQRPRGNEALGWWTYGRFMVACPRTKSPTRMVDWIPGPIMPQGIATLTR